MTAKRRVRFFETSHVTGSSSRRNTGVRQARRIFTKAWNRRSGEKIWPDISEVYFQRFFEILTIYLVKRTAQIIITAQSY